MNRRYKKYGPATEEFWQEFGRIIRNSNIPVQHISRQMGKHESALRIMVLNGLPLSPENLNLFSVVLGLEDNVRKHLHLLAARGIGYEV